MIGYTIFISAVAVSMACISYSIMARSQGWPVGEILAKDASLPKIAAFVTTIWALGKSFIVFEWWSPIVILVTGWFVAFVLTSILKQFTQVVCVIGVFPAFIVTTSYVSESKPFGWLQQLFG